MLGTIIVRRSRLLIVVLIILYVLAGVAVVITQIAVWIKLVLLITLCALFYYYCRILCLLSDKSITGFRLPVNTEYWILYRNNGTKTVVELLSSHVFQSLIFLTFRDNRSRRAIRLMLATSSVGLDIHRKLRVYLRNPS